MGGRPMSWESIMRCVAAALALALCAALPASAVLMDSGDGTGNTTAPSDDPGWKNAGSRGGLNAVYLGHGWVVTAAHVGIGTVTLDGTVYSEVSGSYVPILHSPTVNADLGVFRIDPFPRALPALEIPMSTVPVGADVMLIGSGQRRGAATDWMGVGGWLWAGGAVKRWGSNEIGARLGPGPPVNTTDLPLAGYTTRALVVDFSEGEPGDEATVTVGDSGGAFFVRDGSAWKLGGVSFGLGTFENQPLNTSLYGNIVYAADLSHYRDQILAVARPCADGVDNDGDQAADFPADTGCTWSGDLSELPDCDDGIDNDNDGAVDMADSFCSSFGDLREEPDADSDGVTDAEDSCLFVANQTQLDSDQDGYGNACDADYNNDGVVGTSDFSTLRNAFGSTQGSGNWDPQLDANGDGVIGTADFTLLRAAFGIPPGPSGLACAGSVPCP
jgi:hypothetical protein